MPNKSAEFNNPDLAKKIVEDMEKRVTAQGLSMSELLRNALSTQRGFEQPVQPLENPDDEQPRDQ